MRLLNTLTLLLPSLIAATQPAARQTSLSTLLLDIFSLPVPGATVRDINISLITFNDEVFDISNIAILGNVNDGTVNCTETPEAGEEVLVTMPNAPAASSIDVSRINVSLITFGDEVFDISNIAIWGDVNDSGC